MAVGRDLLLLFVGALAGLAAVNTFLAAHGAPRYHPPARPVERSTEASPSELLMRTRAPETPIPSTETDAAVPAPPEPSPPQRSATECPSAPDDSYVGMKATADGIMHAFPDGDAACYGARHIEGCIAPATVEYLRKHVRIGIVSGRKGGFRVEVSQCTWLAHYPPETVTVFTDVVPAKPRTPHRWVALGMPPNVTARNCDVFSPYIKKGYHRAVRKDGQGYSVSWIKAQFRFLLGLQHLGQDIFAEPAHGADVKWALLIDDDTIVSPDRLVKRLQALDERRPWYLSRKGWGGAGHFYSREAMRKVYANVSDCIDRWMVRQFRASDTVLLKCGHHLRLHVQMEDTMSHCPASTLRQRLLDPRLVTMHGKKDFYPPTKLTVWRTALYYLAAVCNNNFAKDAIIEYSACTYGASCRTPGCDREKDRRTVAKWVSLSKNNTLTTLPLEPYYADVRRHLADAKPSSAHLSDASDRSA